MTKLSILILTIPSRERMLNDLVTRLRVQIQGKPVEILLHRNPKQSIGNKRNALLAKSAGEYVVFIDDDDMISRDYVNKILAAVETGPDCIGISGVITHNGRKEKQWHISKDYGHWHQKESVYYRTPNHISPVKRSIAVQVGFPPINHGEDAEYSKGILPLLQSEVKVEGNIYTYRYRSKK
jgi:glycosyltransferase involved in cell wall biosynthesis